jgi:hypothetical protein
MIKRKNILAENMLRFRSKNIAAEEAAAIRKLIEQQTKMTVNNVDLIDALKGVPIAIVEDPNYDLIAFPNGGQYQAGVPTIKSGAGAVYQSRFIKNDLYAGKGADTILLGNIGKLTGGEGNWGIADNSALKVFTYTKSNVRGESGASIIPEGPYSTPTIVTDPAPIISTLTKAKHGNRSFEGTEAQKYIADLVNLFKTMNQLTEVGIDADSIMKYTREKLT